MKIKIGFGGILFLLCSFFSQDRTVSTVYMLAAIFHELGHIAAARWLGIELDKITLEVTGAKIYPKRQFSSYREEWLLSLAGPAANVVAFGLSCIMLGVNTPHILENALGLLSGENMSGLGVVSLFAVFSCLQATLNLLPVSTFDGGRIFYCFLANKIGDRAAVTGAKISSGVFAVLLWLAAVYFLLKTGAGISLFCFAMCMLFGVMNDI